jgi:hypothetical protein
MEWLLHFFRKVEKKLAIFYTGHRPLPVLLVNVSPDSSSPQ